MSVHRSHDCFGRERLHHELSPLLPSSTALGGCGARLGGSAGAGERDAGIADSECAGQQHAWGTGRAASLATGMSAGSALLCQSVVGAVPPAKAEWNGAGKAQVPWRDPGSGSNPLLDGPSLARARLTSWKTGRPAAAPSLPPDRDPPRHLCATGGWSSASYEIVGPQL